MFWQNTLISETTNKERVLYGPKNKATFDIKYFKKNKIANKRGKVRKFWILVYFLWLRISETAKTPNNEGFYYKDWHLHWLLLF
jgi:hypothetical protein